MNITDRAMLVGLNIRQWSAVKHDKKVSSEVATAHGSDSKMGRYNKNLVSAEALAELKRIAGAARAEHYHRTLPWGDDGFRILTSAGYFDYNAKMSEFRQQFETALSTFTAGYSQYVEDARTRLNGLFNPADYPRSIERKFGFEVSVRPVPDADDFRVDIGTAETARIKRDIQDQVNQTIQTAMAELSSRSPQELIDDRYRKFRQMGNFFSEGK